MKPSDTSFTEIYAQWLQSFRAMFPGGARPSAEDTLPPKAKPVAVQEWEGEGGTVKAVPTPEEKDQPKIPF